MVRRPGGSYEVTLVGLRHLYSKCKRDMGQTRRDEQPDVSHMRAVEEVPATIRCSYIFFLTLLIIVALIIIYIVLHAIYFFSAFHT